jgi:hypothetical protein
LTSEFKLRTDRSGRVRRGQAGLRLDNHQDLLTAGSPYSQECIDPTIDWFCLVLLQAKPPIVAEQVHEPRDPLFQQVTFAELKPGHGTN